MKRNNQKRFSTMNRIQWAIQRNISWFVALLCDCEWKWLKTPLIALFKHFYRVNINDCVTTRLRDYKSLNDFFIRSLRKGTRTLSEQPNAVLSPVDGCISEMGAIQGETLIQAKGKTYTLYDLLAEDKEMAALFENGYFCTLYLSPSDYHRIHMPVTGRVLSMTYVPGFLFSVGHYNTQRVSQLFTRNERVISLFDTKVGKLAMIQVGSCLVGHMGTVWEGGDAIPHRNRKSKIEKTIYSDASYQVKQTLEMGYFKLGSTVIMLMQKQPIHWKDSLCVGKKVRCGEVLGEITP